MSVNGLDAGNVASAYQHVLNASNGWFLMHYISRDELGIFEHGTDGFQGLQAAVAGYSEKSPLYGFLSYRQRHVVLRYIPEGTSRLLQARTSVHFQSVVDRFATHDAVVQFKSLNDVSESTLSGALELQDDTVSVMTLTATVKHEQMSPIEDVAESQSVNPQVSTILARLKAAKLAQADEDADVIEASNDHTSSDSVSTTPMGTTHPLSSVQDVENQTLQEDLEAFTPDILSEVHDEANYQLNPQQESRLAARMSLDINFTPWKPKEKQFARPVTDEKLKKSQLAGFFRQRLPSGLRRGRKASEPKIPSDPPRTQLATLSIPTTEAKPSLAPSPYAISPNRLKQPTFKFVDDLKSPQSPLHIDAGISQSIIRSAEITATAARTSLTYNQNPLQAQSVMTPERQRLMRALSLRRKQLDASKQHENNAQSIAGDEMDNHAYAGKTSNVDSGIDVGETSESEDISPVTRSVPSPTLPQTAPKTDANALFQQFLPFHKRDSNQLQIDTCIGRQDETSRKSTEIRTQRPRRSVLARSRSSKNNCAKSDVECTNSYKWDSAAQAELAIHDQTTEDDYDSSSSNESLIEEMRSAVVEEARRISIPSSPVVKTGFCVDGLSSPYSVTSIVIHTGSNRSRTTSGANSASASCPFPQRMINVINSTQPTKRDNVSSSISKRIQTLNETSNCDHNAILSTEMSSALLAFKRNPLQPSHQAFSSVSPAEDWLSKSFGDPAVQSLQRPQSVSVTAHIVRPKYGSGPGYTLAAGESSELQRSNLHIQQHIPEDGPSMSFTGLERIERPQSVFAPKSASRRSSLVFSSRHSMDIGERVQQYRISHPKPRSLPDGNLSKTSLDCGDDRMDAVKQKRAARMFKRLSATFHNTSSRQPIAELSEPATADRQTSPLLPRNTQGPTLFAIGELDVQFPDSLLWKRRWVETNGTGNIILSATRVSERINNVPKSYHLSQFRTPLIPSLDRQEMPCSVLLEFHHGGTIQFACGDPVSQAEVLRWLLESHRQWA